MRTFIYNGIEYRSLCECCNALNLSYQKVRRLCRHYRRAQKDPTLAIRWALGIEHLSHLEPKTIAYTQDQERANFRQMKFKDKMLHSFINTAL
jgi:hypothetical protein